jgi:hypothetical protein
MIIISDLYQSHHKELTTSEVSTVIGGRFFLSRARRSFLRLTSSSSKSISSLFPISEGGYTTNSTNIYRVTQTTIS